MGIFKKKLSFNQKGFTLIELMIVIAIMGIVSAAIYNFLSFTQKSYAYADAQTEISQEATLFFTQIEKDIRNAIEPNGASKSINITNEGKQIDIYQYDGSQYQRISYRRNPNNSMQLEKGSVSSNNQVMSQNPAYGAIDNWKTVCSYLLPGNAGIFVDRSNATSSRRLIDINLSLKHPKTSTALNMKTSVLSRSGRSTASIEEGGSTSSAYIPVTGIKFTQVPGRIPNTGKTTTIVAEVIPSDATNRNLVWSRQIYSLTWLNFPEYQMLYDDYTGSFTEEFFEGISDKFGYWDILTTRSGSGVIVEISPYGANISQSLKDWFKKWWGIELPHPRTTKIRVFSPDGVSNTYEIEQNYHNHD